MNINELELSRLDSLLDGKNRIGVGNLQFCLVSFFDTDDGSSTSSGGVDHILNCDYTVRDW